MTQGLLRHDDFNNITRVWYLTIPVYRSTPVYTGLAIYTGLHTTVYLKGAGHLRGRSLQSVFWENLPRINRLGSVSWAKLGPNLNNSKCCDSATWGFGQPHVNSFFAIRMAVRFYFPSVSVNRRRVFWRWQHHQADMSCLLRTCLHGNLGSGLGLLKDVRRYFCCIRCYLFVAGSCKWSFPKWRSKTLAY